LNALPTVAETRMRQAAAARSYAARNATTSTGTASLKLNRDPLGSQFQNLAGEIWHWNADCWRD